MTENKNIDIEKNHEEHYVEHSEEDHDHSNLNLKGTFIMVMSLGGVMVISWVLAFLLFMSRM